MHTTFIDQITDFVKTGNTVDIQAVIASAAATTGNSLANAQLNALNSRGNDLVDAARTSRNLYVAIFVIATGLSVLFALIIAQSISKPLVKIADEAREMATSRLPEAVRGVLATPLGEDVIQPKLEPITVTSTDETALVAASINDVQQRALDLAVEQAAQRRNFADTFLNLGRRVQGLVNRQLEFITDLEDDERDPEVLENLFKLDHLATRIRRNAESLVVLAGVTRRVRSGDPIPVIDVLRSALGEVDEYTRVRIDEVDEARLPLSVAADLSHILAELIENGLNFSPPETDVLTVGVREPDGYRITVADHGIGMDAEQVATANRRLSGNESFTVAPSRYMGHFVAGHLATSLGISVQVTSSPNGTTATIIVANSLLVGGSKAGTGDPLDEPAQDDGTSVLEGVGATSSAGAVNRTSSPAPRNDDSFKPAAPPRAPAIGSLGDLLSTHRRLSDSRETPGDSANH